MWGSWRQWIEGPFFTNDLVDDGPDQRVDVVVRSLSRYPAALRR